MASRSHLLQYLIFSLRLQPQFYKTADDTNLVRAPKIVRHEMHREIVAIWHNRRRPTGLRITNSAQANRESNLVDQIGSSGQSSPRRPRANAIAAAEQIHCSSWSDPIRRFQLNDSAFQPSYLRLGGWYCRGSKGNDS